MSSQSFFKVIVIVFWLACLYYGIKYASLFISLVVFSVAGAGIVASFVVVAIVRSCIVCVCVCVCMCVYVYVMCVLYVC